MDFRGVVRGLARGASVRDAQAVIRAQHGRAASRWLAAEAGVSTRTARRWLSAHPPGSRAPRILAAAQSASVAGLAAQRLRGAAAEGGGIAVGVVAVSYDDDDQGDRDIGWLEINDAMARDLQASADALDAGNLAGAADAFSDAVIGGYGTGLQDTLSVSDYSDGVEL
ncbi:MAG: hypothetical protein ACRDMV_18285 [Streptosporangiales bacterium]